MLSFKRLSIYNSDGGKQHESSDNDVYIIELQSTIVHSPYRTTSPVSHIRYSRMKVEPYTFDQTLPPDIIQEFIGAYTGAWQWLCFLHINRMILQV